jgi:hypothetical protein
MAGSGKKVLAEEKKEEDRSRRKNFMRILWKKIQVEQATSLGRQY